jgi:hypothetical protein
MRNLFLAALQDFFTISKAAISITCRTCKFSCKNYLLKLHFSIGEIFNTTINVYLIEYCHGVEQESKEFFLNVDSAQRKWPRKIGQKVNNAEQMTFIIGRAVSHTLNLGHYCTIYFTFFVFGTFKEFAGPQENV